MSSIKILKKGITSISADAIVNAANTGLWAGGGVCGVIFQKAGMEDLSEACTKIGHCDEGSAVITPGFNCPCKFIIHAVGPRYKDGKHGEAKLLYGAYKASLELCIENKIHSIVFPLISAGIFGYPLYDAWTQAIYACKNFINSNPDYDIDIMFAIPEDEKIKVGEQVLEKERPEINMKESCDSSSALLQQIDREELRKLVDSICELKSEYWMQGEAVPEEVIKALNFLGEDSDVVDHIKQWPKNLLISEMDVQQIQTKLRIFYIFPSIAVQLKMNFIMGIS